MPLWLIINCVKLYDQILFSAEKARFNYSVSAKEKLVISFFIKSSWQNCFSVCPILNYVWLFAFCVITSMEYILLFHLPNPWTMWGCLHFVWLRQCSIYCCFVSLLDQPHHLCGWLGCVWRGYWILGCAQQLGRSLGECPPLLPSMAPPPTHTSFIIP